MTNDNDAPPPKMIPVESPEPTDEELLKVLQARVASLLDEFKRLFVPEMKISFIARHPEEKETFSFMTEDTKEELIAFLQRVEQPKPLVRVDSSEAIS